MTWNTPVSPVAGTVITVAWATSNVVQPTSWLRLMTGNADPPGSAYVVVSSSPTATAWSKVPNGALADDSVDARVLAPGAVTATELATNAAIGNLGYRPVNASGDSAMTGLYQIVGSGGGLVIHGTAGFLADGSAGATLGGSGAKTIQGSGGVFVTDINGMVVSSAAGLSVTGTNGISATKVDSPSMLQSGAPLALASHVNHAGSLALDAGELVVFADVLGDKIQLFSTFGIGINSGQVVLFAAPGNDVVIRDNAYNGTLRGSVIHSGNIGAQSVAHATTADTALDNGVPTGAIVMFRGAGEIPAGWSRETTMDGRIPVGDGTVGGVTFTSFNNYGTTWTPSAGLGVTIGTLAASSSALAASATVAPVGTGGNFASGNSHIHATPTITLSGAPALTGTATLWNPPVTCRVFARKN